MAKRVLITGATGFLGGAAARSLRHAGWDVCTTGRNVRAGEALALEGFRFEPLDLAGCGSKLHLLARNCDAIVHCAALSSPWGPKRAFDEANVRATRNVLEACRSGGARLVHLSTPSVSFGFTRNQDQREDAAWPMPPANHYIATKREAENLVKQHEKVQSIILRPKAIIGPGDTSVLPRVMRAARRGYFPLFTRDEPLLDLTWIDDATEAIRLALEAPDSRCGQVYHITSGQPIPAAEAFALLFEACGLEVRLVPVSAEAALRIASLFEWSSRIATAGHWEPPLTRYSVGSLAFPQTLDISAARRDLGYLPRKDIREALQECGHHWGKQNLNPA